MELGFFFLEGAHVVIIIVIIFCFLGFEVQGFLFVNMWNFVILAIHSGWTRKKNVCTGNCLACCIQLTLAFHSS